MDLNKAARDPWVWGQTFLMLVVLLAAPLLPRYVNLGDADFLLNRVDPAWIRGLGAILLAAGAGTVAWGVRSLGPSLTPGVEPLPGGQLITTGPYAHVRHPIYAGAVLLLTGYTLSWSNWTMAVLVALLTRTYFEAKAKAEERWLIERFPEYQGYMRYVRRRVL
jgi:protein-S-isoprenylcysteine O-methyltransferase Ste14